MQNNNNKKNIQEFVDLGLNFYDEEKEKRYFLPETDVRGTLNWSWLKWFCKLIWQRKKCHQSKVTPVLN